MYFECSQPHCQLSYIASITWKLSLTCMMCDACLLYSIFCKASKPFKVWWEHRMSPGKSFTCLPMRT